MRQEQRQKRGDEDGDRSEIKNGGERAEINYVKVGGRTNKREDKKST